MIEDTQQTQTMNIEPIPGQSNGQQIGLNVYIYIYFYLIFFKVTEVFVLL